MRYLIQFSQQHESFWLPELDTLLELNGVDPSAAYDHDAAWAVVSRGHKVAEAAHYRYMAAPVAAAEQQQQYIEASCCFVHMKAGSAGHVPYAPRTIKRNTSTRYEVLL